MFLIGESAGRVAWCYQVSVANVEDAIRIEYALRHRQKWAIAWQAKAKTEALAKRRTTRRVKKTAKKGHRHV